MLCDPHQPLSPQPFNLASLGVNLKVDLQELASKLVEACDKGVLITKNGQNIPITYKNNQIEMDTQEEEIHLVFAILKKKMVTFLQSSLEVVEKDKLISQAITTLKALCPTEKDWESYRGYEKATKKILKRIVCKNISIVKSDKFVTFTVMLNYDPLIIVVNFSKTDHNLFYEQFLKEVYTYFSQTSDRQNITTEQVRIREYIDKAQCLLNERADFVSTSELKTLVMSYRARFEQFREICAPLTPSPLLIPFTQVIIELQRKINCPASSILMSLCIFKTLGRNPNSELVLDALNLALKEDEETLQCLKETNLPFLLEDISNSIFDYKDASKLCHILISNKILLILSRDQYEHIFYKLFEYLKRDEDKLDNIKLLLELCLAMQSFSDEGKLLVIFDAYKDILIKYLLKTGDIDLYNEHIEIAAKWYSLSIKLINEEEENENTSNISLLLTHFQCFIDLLGDEKKMIGHIPIIFKMIDSMHKVLDSILVENNGTMGDHDSLFVMWMVILCHHKRTKPEFQSKIDDLQKLFYIDDTTSVNSGLTNTFGFLLNVFSQQLTTDLFDRFLKKFKSDRHIQIESVVLSLFICSSKYKINLRPLLNDFIEKCFPSMSHDISPHTKRIMYIYLHIESFSTHENTYDEFMKKLNYCVGYISKSPSTCVKKATLINDVLESDILKIHKFNDEIVIEIIRYLVKVVKDLNWEKVIIRDLALSYINDEITKKYKIDPNVKDYFLNTIHQALGQFPWNPQKPIDDKIITELEVYLKNYRMNSIKGALMYGHSITCNHLLNKLQDFPWKDVRQSRNVTAKIKTLVNSHVWTEYKTLVKALEELNLKIQSALEVFNIEGLKSYINIDDKLKGAIKKDFANLTDAHEEFHTKIYANFNFNKLREYTYKFYIDILHPYFSFFSKMSLMLHTPSKCAKPPTPVIKEYFLCFYDLVNLYKDAILKMDEDRKKQIMIIFANFLVGYFSSNPNPTKNDQKECSEYIEKYLYFTILYLSKTNLKTNLNAFMHLCVLSPNINNSEYYMKVINKKVVTMLTKKK